jgi:hypothetical protein
VRPTSLPPYLRAREGTWYRNGQRASLFFPSPFSSQVLPTFLSPTLVTQKVKAFFPPPFSPPFLPFISGCRGTLHVMLFLVFYQSSPVASTGGLHGRFQRKSFFLHPGPSICNSEWRKEQREECNCIARCCHEDDCLYRQRAPTLAPSSRGETVN